MRKSIVHAFLLIAAAGAGAQAATLTLNNAALSGLPDATVGWGFTIESPDWLLVTFADFVPDPGVDPVGVFTAFITQPPNSNMVVVPGSPWTQPFDDLLMTGI